MVFARINIGLASGANMFVILRKLEKSVAPAMFNSAGTEIAYLTRDSYAHSLCALLRSDPAFVYVSMFAISVARKARNTEINSVFRTMESMAAQGIICKIILASGNPFAKTGKFNDYASQRLINAGWKVRWGRRSELIHQKQFIIGRTALVVGSHNVSDSSSNSNLDISIAVAQQDLISQAIADYNRLWNNSSKKKA